MKAQAISQKCPSPGSLKSTGRRIVNISVHKLNGFPEASRYQFITGVIKKLNRIILFLSFSKRYFILPGDCRGNIHPITGYAVIDAVNKTRAVKLTREILDITSSAGTGDYYITLAVRTDMNVCNLKTFASSCHADWVNEIEEVNNEKA